MHPRRSTTHASLLALALVFAIGAPARAAETLLVPMSDEVVYAVPSNSPVEYLGPGAFPSDARFRGRFRLDGTYHYGYLNRDTRHQALPHTLDLVFLPDDALRGTLPYWQRRGPVREIRFRNPQEFADTVIPQYATDELRDRSRFSVSGRASVWVTAFEASVECDAPRYLVDFVSSAGAATAFTDFTLLDPSGC